MWGDELLKTFIAEYDTLFEWSKNKLLVSEGDSSVLSSNNAQKLVRITDDRIG